MCSLHDSHGLTVGLSGNKVRSDKRSVTAKVFSKDFFNGFCLFVGASNIRVRVKETIGTAKAFSRGWILKGF